jgi:hypothetical protein
MTFCKPEIPVSNNAEACFPFAAWKMPIDDLRQHKARDNIACHININPLDQDGVTGSLLPQKEVVKISYLIGTHTIR